MSWSGTVLNCRTATSQKCEAVRRRARIQGSWTFVLLNSGLERDKEQEEVSYGNQFTPSSPLKPKSAVSSRWISGPDSRSGSLNSLFQVAVCLTFLVSFLLLLSAASQRRPGGVLQKPIHTIFKTFALEIAQAKARIWQ